MRIYCASSWRNVWQPAVVRLIRALGHDVYDFRHPKPGDDGFHWSAIDPAWQDWDAARYRAALTHPVAEAGFESDMDALDSAEACVLVQPCGTSAHLELGWAIGAGKRTAVLFPLDIVPTTPEVGSHSMNGLPCTSCDDLDGCHLPGKLRRIEPELMSKMADAILLSAEELRSWIRLADKREEVYRRELARARTRT